MAYIVFISKECANDAERHSLRDKLDYFKAKIEREQYIGQLERLGASDFYIKKKFYRFQTRLITKIVPVNFGGESHDLVVFLAVIIRGDKNYISFQENPENIAPSLFRGRYTENELKKYLEETFKQVSLPDKEPVRPAYLDYLTLHHVKIDDEKNDPIYESRTWVTKVTDYSKGFTNIFPELCNCLNKIFSKIAEKERGKDLFYTDSTHGIEIHYAYLNDGGLFLIDIKKNGGEFENPRYITEKIENGEEIVDSFIYKSYPWYILGDEPAWRELEKDAKNNYILSFEESETFKSALQERKYPLFINGRAGSGKSTILQYIFTEYYANAVLMEEEITPPAYFTYSKKLKESAQDFVKGLLKNNSKFTYLPQGQRMKLQRSLEESLNNSDNPMQIFQWTDFLTGRVQDSDMQRKFKDPSLHITYSKFKTLWTKKRGQNPEDQKYGVDLTWHIIRTYIKGLDPDGDTDAEDYALLPKKQKTVDEESYRHVYTRIWPWYKDLCEKNNYWDDQDLARYVLENNLIHPTFPGIFCDEAQDFTQLEIDIIIRLSYFFDKKVARGLEKNIPFVFAGDEMQTLNPTGFRWDSLKAWLSEKFISKISSGGDEQQAIDDSQFKTFKINYRSPKSIVNFCNTIQLFRSSIFDIPNVTPQEAWSDIEDMNVYYFDSNNAKFWDNVPIQENIVFLIPCNEGEEDEWRKKDKILKDKSNYLVFSPAAVKGLEYHWVVLYRFGEMAPEGATKPKNIEAKRLEVEYYFNKTYVAASRATKRLLVVDTEKDNFWGFCSPQRYAEPLQALKEKGNRNGWDEKFLTPFMDGDMDALNPDKNSNPEETAKKTKDLGMNECSPYYMRQAAAAYRNIGKEQEAKFCEAYSFVYDNKYKEAGENFQVSGYIDEAIECFWLSQNMDCFLKIKELITKTNSSDWSLISAFSNALMERNEIDALRIALDEFTKRGLPKNRFGSDKDHSQTLGKNIERVVDKLGSTQQYSVLNAPLIEKTLKKIHSLGLSVSQKHKEMLVISLDKIGYAEKSIELWEDIWEDRGVSKQFEPEYHRIKVEVTTFPKNLESLKYLERWDNIKNDYEACGQYDLRDRDWEIIADAYAKLREYKAIVTLLYHVNDELTRKKIEAMIPRKEYSALSEQEEIFLIFEKGDWKSIYQKMYSLHMDNKKDSDRLFALCLARMDIPSLPDTPKENTTKAPLTRKDISEFLSKKILPHVEELPILFMKDIGAAFEKAGNHTNVLNYYEKCMNHIVNKEYSKEFALRWIACKERQGKRKSSDSLRKRREMGIPLTQDLPEYPELSDWGNLRKILSEYAKKQGKTLKEVTQTKKSNLPLRIAGLTYTYYPQHKRLLIEDKSIEGNIIRITNGEVQVSDFSLETLEDSLGEYTHISGTSFCFRSIEGKLRIWDSNNPQGAVTFD